MVNLGDVFPNFKADSSEGPIEFHKFIEGTWAILFSHPADFTPVCTTELGCVAQLDKEFSDRGVKMIALSCDDVQSHKDWIQDVNAYSGKDSFPYPIIADPKREIAVNLGLIDPEEKDSKGLPLTCRSLFIIGPDKRLKLAILYPATTGRNFREVIRVVDSLQLTATKKVATPVDWKVGEDCMVLPNISQEEAAKLFPKGVRIKEMPSGKPYLRYTPQPE